MTEKGERERDNEAPAILQRSHFAFLLHPSVPILLLLLSVEGKICLVGVVVVVVVVSESESRLVLMEEPTPPPPAAASISPSEVILNAPVEEDDDANKCLTAGASDEDDTD